MVMREGVMVMREGRGDGNEGGRGDGNEGGYG